MIVRLRIFLLVLSIIFLVSFFSPYRFLIVFSVVPVIVFRDVFPMIVSYVFKVPVCFSCEVKSNYVYFPQRSRIVVVYRVEPLLNLERLRGETYLSLVRDFVKRVLVNDDVAVGFFVKSDVKYFIVNIEFSDVERSKNILSSIENVLGEYFMFRRVEGRELELLFTYRPFSYGRLGIALLIPSLASLVLFGIYGLAAALACDLVFYFYCRRLFIYDSLVSLLYSCTRNRLLFMIRDPDTVKSDALHVSRCRCSYLLMFRRCRELETVAREKLHREQESLVVKERGRSYSEVLAWRNVIDRLNYGEEPLIMSMNVSSRELEPYFNLSPGDVTYILDHSRLSTHALTGDVAILIPMHSSTGTVYESSRKIFVGYDRSGKEVNIDIDSLPSNHVIIVGPTGMGKSWTCKTILTEL
ncbi:MAG: ATP-binding protein, partial [Crenarchaeota archaeon]|nr:ATP-binding protein [Thermoproteota archaeon]